VPFTVSADQGWIALSATSATTASAIQVGANISGMAAGTYSGHVIISAAGVDERAVVDSSDAFGDGGSTTDDTCIDGDAERDGVHGAGRRGGSSGAEFDDWRNPAGAVAFTAAADQAWLTLSANFRNDRGNDSGWRKYKWISGGKLYGARNCFGGGRDELSDVRDGDACGDGSAKYVRDVRNADVGSDFGSGRFDSGVPERDGGRHDSDRATSGGGQFRCGMVDGDADEWKHKNYCERLREDDGTYDRDVDGTRGGGGDGAEYRGYTVNNSPMSIPVTLTITSAQSGGTITVNPTSVAFGNINLSNSNTKNVTVTNSGTGSVTISQISVTGSGLSANGITTPMTLSAGQTTVLSIVYSPTQLGLVAGSVTITSDATNSPTVIVATGPECNRSLRRVRRH